MRLRSPSPFLRFVAAVTLLVWLTAPAFCSHACTVRAPVSGQEENVPPCHRAAHQKSTPAQNAQCACSFCDSIRKVTEPQANKTVSPPNLLPLWTLSPLLGWQISALPDPGSSVFREAIFRDWVFTPEVCLGPAFRSLAPPVA